MPQHSHLRLYVYAVLSTVVALAARLLMDTVLGIHSPYATFFVAVAFSASVGGIGPGVLATILGAFGATYYLVPPRRMIWFADVYHQAAFGLYLFVSAILIVLAERQRRTRLRLRQEVAARSLAEAEERSRSRQLSQEVAERERAEQAVRASEARARARASELDAIMQAVPAATFIARDPECRHVVGSAMSYDLLRLPPGSNLSVSAPEDERPATFRAIKDGRELPPHEFPVQKAAATVQPVRDDEFEVVFDDGTSRFLLGNAVPLLGDDGRPRGAVGAFVDITDRKRAEERLRESQKLESVGLLAAGVAHDFNNLLVGVVGNIDLARESLPRHHPAREMLDAAMKSSERAAELVKQMLAYSGKGSFVVEPVNIAQAISETIRAFQLSIPDRIAVRLHLDYGLPAIRADRSQVQQIAANLMLNAVEAIGNQAGAISVATGARRLTEAYIDRHLRDSEAAPGMYVYLTVRDTGCGMDEAVRSRIFDPFFTTKFTGRGLGLAAVAGIVRSYSGAIQLTTAPKKGSTFTVWLPAIQQAVVRQEPIVHTPPPAGSGQVNG